MKRISSLTFLVVLLLARPAIARKPTEPQYAPVNVIFHCCLEKKFPDIERPHIAGREATAFDPKTGRNFAWDTGKQAWIDVKTGERICPDSKDSSTALVNVFFHCCLEKKFPDIERPHVAGREATAFDPKTGRNFAWDTNKQAWIDVKTGRCICPECEEKQTAHAPPTPTPSTTDKVTDVLKTIGSSVSIGIGGGYSSGHNERHHGEDRHRTADKVSTDKTKTHTTSPTTTHKTVTSACKCHPCTCSPCRCH